MHYARERSKAAVIGELLAQIAMIEAETEALVLLYNQLRSVLSGDQIIPGHNTSTAESN
jgi:hypothetical protein